MLEHLETELKLRGFSDRTVRAYMIHNAKFLEFSKKEHKTPELKSLVS